MTLELNDKLTKWKSEFGRDDDLILDTLYMRFPWDLHKHMCAEII